VDPRVGPLEDAALLRPEGGPPLVFTVDFVTPIVDHPESFGAVAAANALSDVYAMGGEPQVALAICGYPEDRLDRQTVARILAGGRDKAAEAGCAIVGGHTILDPELKYGLCVLGTVPRDRALTHLGARPGDQLVLTKPLGTGIAAQALKRGALGSAAVEVLTRSMATLNRAAKDAALAADVRAATDVTGFGLLAHLHHLLLASGVGARLSARAVPRFEFAEALVGEGHVPGGTRRNLAYVSPQVRFAASVGEADRLILADAQTSGGLLLAAPAQATERLLSDLARRGTPAHARIGEITAGPPGRIEVEA
jgi:selenide,water dikinase